MNALLFNRADKKAILLQLVVDYKDQKINYELLFYYRTEKISLQLLADHQKTAKHQLTIKIK